jgi:hypothetical protein
MPKLMLVPKSPAIIIMESPLAKPFGDETPRMHKCMTCRDLFRLSEASYRTMRELRARRDLYLIFCYPCFLQVRPHLAHYRGQEGVTTDEARKLLGLL